MPAMELEVAKRMRVLLMRVCITCQQNYEIFVKPVLCSKALQLFTKIVTCE